MNLETENRPTISWGAILAGAFIVFTVNAALIALGGGIGFSAFDPEQGESLGRVTMISGAIYWLIAGLVSLFVGGYVASRMSGFRDRGVAGLHGLCSWAVASAVTLGLAATGVGNVIGAAAGMVGSGVKGAAQAGVGAASGMNLDLESIRKEVRQALTESGKPELRPENLERRADSTADQALGAQANQGGEAGANVVRREANEVGASVDNGAVANVLSQRLGISREEAASLIGQGEEQASAVIAAVKARGLEAAGKTTDAAAYFGFFTFFSLMLGALAGYSGGVFGSPLGFSSDTVQVVKRRPIETARA